MAKDINVLSKAREGQNCEIKNYKYPLSTLFSLSSPSSLEYSTHTFPKCSATLCLSRIMPDAVSSPASTAKLLSLDVNGGHFYDWWNKNMNAGMTVLY